MGGGGASTIITTLGGIGPHDFLGMLSSTPGQIAWDWKPIFFYNKTIQASEGI